MGRDISCLQKCVYEIYLSEVEITVAQGSKWCIYNGGDSRHVTSFSDGQCGVHRFSFG